LAASFSAAVSVTTRKTIATERFPSLTSVRVDKEMSDGNPRMSAL